MKKLNAHNLKENIDYFTDILKVCYSIVIKINLQKKKLI